MTTDHLQLTELIRSDSPTEASAEAVRRLLAVVAEWPAGTGVDLTFGTHDGSRLVTLEPTGTPTPGWEGDLRWAMGGVARLEGAAGAGPFSGGALPAELMRLRPARDLQHRLPLSVEDLEPPRGLAAMTGRGTPWPQPLHDDLREVAQLLADEPGLVLRWRLGSPTPVERDMVDDAYRSTAGGGPAEIGNYLGRPVRLVVLIGTFDGLVPRRALVMAKRWATALDAAPVVDVAGTWSDPAALLGEAVPERTALGLLRIPAAGASPFPGIATQHRPVPDRALDPVPAAPDEPICLGTATTVSGGLVDVMVAVPDFLRHYRIDGQSGAGKSTLLATMVRGLMARGVGCTFLDPHGATVDLLESEMPARSDAVRVVRFADADHPVPMNLLRGTQEEIERAVELFGELMTRLYDPNNDGIVGPRWRRWFGLIATATWVVLGERASLVAVAEVGRDAKRIGRLAAALPPSHADLARSLLDEIVNDRGAEAASTLAWCMSKLHPLVATGQLRAVLGTGHDALDMVQALDSSTTLLVDLGSPVLGAPASRLLCALILEKIRIAMGARRRRDLVHVVVIDEAHLVQFGALDSLLSEARKFGIGIVVASQYHGQYRRSVAESLDANAGSVVSFRTSLSDAPGAGLRLGGWPAAELVRLPALRAATSLSRDGTMTEPFTLHVDHHDRMAAGGHRDGAASRRAGQVRARSLRDLWLPYRDATVPTAADLDVVLGRAAPARPRSGPPTGRPDAGQLDEWLAQRRTREALNRAVTDHVDDETPTTP